MLTEFVYESRSSCTAALQKIWLQNKQMHCHEVEGGSVGDPSKYGETTTTLFSLDSKKGKTFLKHCFELSKKEVPKANYEIILDGGTWEFKMTYEGRTIKSEGNVEVPKELSKVLGTLKAWG